MSIVLCFASATPGGRTDSSEVVICDHNAQDVLTVAFHLARAGMVYLALALDDEPPWLWSIAMMMPKRIPKPALSLVRGGL